jgi:hypothetical protein
VSFGGISEIIDFIFPRSRRTIFRAFNEEMEHEKFQFQKTYIWYITMNSIQKKDGVRNTV